MATENITRRAVIRAAEVLALAIRQAQTKIDVGPGATRMSPKEIRDLVARSNEQSAQRLVQDMGTDGFFNALAEGRRVRGNKNGEA